ncbi:MAG: hypothetical protein AAFQ84_11025 [Pseudomonadota bacterium]
MAERKRLSVPIGLARKAVSAGRSLVRGQIDRRAERLIRSKTSLVRRQLKSRTTNYLRRNWRRFAVVAAIKFALLAGLLAVAYLLEFPASWTRLGLASLLIAYLARDIWVFHPLVGRTIQEIRRFGLRPKRILSENVAAIVFDEVMAESDRQSATRLERVAFSLAQEDRDEVIERIAKHISDLASEASWKDLSPYLTMAAVRFVTIGSLYAALVFWAIYLSGAVATPR